MLADILPKDILKDSICVDETTPKKNFKENIKEKYSSKRSIEESLKKTTGQRLYEKKSQCCRSAPSTPRIHRKNLHLNARSTSEAPSPNLSPYFSRRERLTLFSPVNNFSQDQIENRSKQETKHIISKNSPRVSRNLLNFYPKDNQKDTNSDERLCSSLPYTSTQISYTNLNATVPLYYDYKFKENHIQSEEGITSFSSKSVHDSGEESNNSADVVSSDSFMFQNEDLSDCEKEVESFFLDKLEPPPHSSTPKVILKKFTSTPCRYSNNAVESTKP